jgi:hypothetical protein
MSTREHTPGPWKRYGLTIYASQHYRNRFSASLQAGIDADNKWTPYEELEANARLMASAPDLLAALKAIITWNNDTPWEDRVKLLDEAANLIARAEGRADVKA